MVKHDHRKNYNQRIKTTCIEEFERDSQDSEPLGVRYRTPDLSKQQCIFTPRISAPLIDPSFSKILLIVILAIGVIVVAIIEGCKYFMKQEKAMRHIINNHLPYFLFKREPT
jgi:hypothetical protein